MGKSLNLLVLGLIVMGTAMAWSEPVYRVKDLERYIAVDNVCAWPNLTMLRDGTIVAAIFNKPSHGQQAGDVDCWASSDGRFWHYRGTPTRHDPETVRMNCAAGLANNGDLIVLCSGWSNIQQPGQPKKAAFRDAILAPWVCRSADGGFTWETRKEFPAKEEGMTEWIPFGDILSGADGTLGASCYVGKKDGKEWLTYFFRSVDDGRTWKKISVISPAHNETALFYLGGNKWLAAARIDHLDLFHSDDNGETWQAAGKLSEASQHPGHILRLQDGRLLLTYGNRVNAEKGVCVKISSDEGRTWSAPLKVADSMPGSDCGYPSSVQRADGKIVTAFYSSSEQSHNRYHMGVSIWNLEIVQ